MLIVADGGATKVDWKIRDDAGRDFSLVTAGANPTYLPPAEVERVLRSELPPAILKSGAGALYYYGAGCGDASVATAMAGMFRQLLPGLAAHVRSDLLGAGLATSAGQPGIVCILGTGSNSMLFDGERLVDAVPNLGLWIGDEGSGAHIGRELMRAWFYREMPGELAAIAASALPEGRTTLLKEVYHSLQPGKFLAGFARLFAAQQEHPFVRRLIGNCFEEFLKRHVCKYDGHRTLPVHFTGSVAWHYTDILSESLRKMGLLQGLILQKPIEQLFGFHLKTSTSQLP